MEVDGKGVVGNRAPSSVLWGQLWDELTEELVMLIAQMLAPVSTENAWKSAPLRDIKNMHAQSSLGASHWMRLCKSLFDSAPWRAQLYKSRRNHYETVACCRVLESHLSDEPDWPLQVLRLRSSKLAASTALSHALPISRQTLRTSYWAVAKEVHPDRLQVPLATQAMTVLNEAYRMALLHFTERQPQDVILLDAQGQDHSLL